MQRTMILQSRLIKAVITKSSSFDTHGAFVCLLWLLQRRNKCRANGPLAPVAVQLAGQNGNFKHKNICNIIFLNI
jgi:hypothetical protein